jgi:Uma2 family endonuclease
VAAPQRRERFATVVPDLVVEILSPSTARRDRTEKKAIYAANGVREYWLVDPRRRHVVVHALRGAGYDAGTTFASGVVSSKVLPRLRLTVEEILRD